MIGASRTSIAALREAVDARFDTADADALAQDGQSVLSFAGVLGRERTLRQTLADPAMESDGKRDLLHRLLDGKVPDGAFDLIARTVTLRWSTDRDMVAGMVSSGESLLLMSAEKQGRLDRVEDEIFRFGRIIDANPTLQMALTNPALDGRRKAAMIADLLRDKADPLTAQLLETATAELHGRPVQDAVEELSSLAARRRGRVVADVRSAIPLSDEQSRRLTDALSRIHHREVQLNVTVDPTVVGGLEVRIGDEVIDGTLSTRIETARRRLAH